MKQLVNQSGPRLGQALAPAGAYVQPTAAAGGRAAGSRAMTGALAGPLILIVTRRCNLRCGWCPQGFEERDMGEEVLASALKGFVPRLRSPRRIKLFGGEPLLRPDLVIRAVESASGIAVGIGIELATNGALLDEKMRAFLALHPEVEVCLSRPWPWLVSLPNVSMNFLIAPDEDAASVLGRFAKAVAAGLRRFNFLPAYFTAWSPEKVRELGRAFGGLRLAIERLRGRGFGIEVKNLSYTGQVPLFNCGVTVDTDGAVYSSNAILARGGSVASRGLLMGHVLKPEDLSAPSHRAPSQRRRILQDFLNKSFGNAAMGSTRKVDAALSEFVYSLQGVAYRARTPSGRNSIGNFSVLPRSRGLAQGAARVAA